LEVAARPTVEVVEFARDRLGFAADERQAEVLRSPARRMLLACSRQWGKSTVAGVKAVHRAYTEAGSLVLVASPSVRQSAEFLRKAEGLVVRLGVRVRGDGENAASLLFPNGSRIVGLPGTEATVRGFSAVSMMLIDEAAQVKDDLYDAVRPMLAVSDGDLWLMSTPRGRAGFFWREWSRGGDGWLRVSVPATECPRIPAKFLEEERRAKADRVFRQEYLCDFTDAERSVFREDLIRRAIRADVTPLFEPGRR
jgi:hypothetical protein